MTVQDYEYYDLLICMDGSNMRRMHAICGGDPEGKMHMMLEYAGRSGDVADPWYSGDFTQTWNDIQDGCRRILEEFL